MKITPLDIKQQRFKQVRKGADRDEVRDFLHLVAEEVEDVVRENMYLEDELGKRTHQLQLLKDRENALKETMLTAQKVTEDMKSTVKKESELVLAEAQLEADKIINQAHDRIAELRAEINDLKKERTTMESDLRHVLNTHTRLLDIAKDVEEEAAASDNTVQFMRR